MATERRPIVLIGNTLHELPAGDYLPGLGNALTTENSYTKTEIDLKLTNLTADAIDTSAVIQSLDLYSKAEIDIFLGDKPSRNQVYIKSEIDAYLNYKANLSDVYIKSMVYNKNEVYKKTETYGKLELYTKSEIDVLFANFGALTANDVYTKNEVDLKISAIPTATNTVDLTTFNNTIENTKTWVRTYFLNINDGLKADYLTTNHYLTKSDCDVLYVTTGNSYTKTEVENRLATKANLNDVYTKSVIDTMITGGGGVSTSNFYTKSEVFNKTEITAGYYGKSYIDSTVNSINDAILLVKNRVSVLESGTTSGGTTGGTTGGTVDLTNYYKKTEVDTKLASYLTLATASLSYATVANTYTKSDIDAKLGDKINNGTVYFKADTYAKTETYSKAEVDAKVYNKADVYTKTETYSKTEVDGKLTNIDTSKLVSKADLVAYKPANNMTLTELNTIVVANVDTKVYSGLVMNPKFTMVYVNRAILYNDEYTISTDGSTLTLKIDLIKNDKIKIFTAL